MSNQQSPKIIVSYNVNGIRSAISKGFLEWMDAGQFDFVCVQETKAHIADIPVAGFETLGYHHYFHSAEKKGYSGVGIFSKIQPDKVVIGCGIEKYDREGRIIRADFGDWSILNCYFPSGTTGDERQNFKYQFLDEFLIWINELKKERQKLIVVGDFNIAHQEIDIHSPKTNQNSSGFLPAERQWMSKWFSSGFTDAFRKLYPDAVAYSWWSFRAGARSNNKGWRIDYQSVTDDLAEKLVDLKYLPDVIHSDHCPILMTIDL